MAYFLFSSFSVAFIPIYMLCMPSWCVVISPQKTVVMLQLYRIGS